MRVHVVGSQLLVLVLCISPSLGSGCNGYKIKTFDIASRCAGGNDIVEFENFKVDFSNDCKVIANGCINLKRPFVTSKSTYSLRHGMFRKDGNHDDSCKVHPKPQAKVILDNLGFGNSCPPEPGKRCYNRKELIDISQYRSQIGMGSGRTDIDVTTDHGDAGHACVKLAVVIGL